MTAEDECQFLIGQTLVCLHLLLSADLHEVREKKYPEGEISAIVAFVSSCFSHVSVTAAMSRFLDITYSGKGEVLGLIDPAFIVAILDVTYSGKGGVLGLIDPALIVAILILSFEPERPGFKLTSLARRSKIANLKDGLEGGSVSNLRLKHTFTLLSPHDALKHHFTSLKTDLISLQPRVFE